MRIGPRLQAALAALLFSTAGAAIKACVLSAWPVACLRSAAAAVVLLAFVPAARRRWTPAMAAVALVYGVNMVCFVAANKLTSAASTIFIQSTAPLYVLLLSPRVLGEPVRRSDVVYAGALAVGLVLLIAGVDPPQTTAPHPLLGNLLAALGGASFGLALLGLRWLAVRGDEAPVAVVAAGNLFVFAVCLPFALPFTEVSAIDGALVAYLGVFQIAVAYLLLTAAMRKLRALETSLLLLLEPLFNPVWAWLFQGERPGALALAGGIVVLVASVLRGWWEQRE